MSQRGPIQIAGLLIVILIVVFGLATLIGMEWAGPAAIATIMAAAGILGIDNAVGWQSPFALVSGVLLVASGGAGVVVTISGGNPFERWEIIIPMAIGLAIGFFLNNESDEIDQQPEQD